MGTRSLTRVFDGNAQIELLCIYRQYDGYLAGHGASLMKALEAIGAVHNGAGDLAAQLVMLLKIEQATRDDDHNKALGRPRDPRACWGNIYVYPVCSEDCGEEFEYHIRTTPKGLEIQAFEITFGSANVPSKRLPLLAEPTLAGLRQRVEQHEAEIKAREAARAAKVPS